MLTYDLRWFFYETSTLWTRVPVALADFVTWIFPQMGHVAESQRKIFPVVSATVTHCDLRSTFHAPLLSRSNWNKIVQKKITELFAETFSCSLYICADLRNDVSLQKSNSFFVLSTLNSFPLPCLFFNPCTSAIGFISFLSCYLFLFSLFFFPSHLLPSLPFLLVSSSPSSLESCAWHVLYL